MSLIKRGPRWAAIVPVAALLLAACGGDGGSSEEKRRAAPEAAANIVQPGAPGEESRKLTAEEAAGIKPPKHSAADVDFMRGMIHHHRQALEMTALVQQRTTNRDIRLLSKRIELSQETELETIQRWLRERDVTGPQQTHGHGAGDPLMPGMLTAGQLDRLAAAEGRAFDRQFLIFMTRHHRGALTMVAQLDAAGGGLEPEIGVFTRHVEADQSIEIGRMRELLQGDRGGNS
jgi:uncharacterized protein (DUF305 family)